MRPRFDDYVPGYTWRSKVHFADQFGRPVLVKAGWGYSTIQVRFDDGRQITCDKCCVRRSV